MIEARRSAQLDTRIAATFINACTAELDALKPGNVHRFAGGHRMTVTDFEASAQAAAAPLATLGLGVGARVLRGVAATRAAVGQNTNLGILLLCAPLAVANERFPERPLAVAVREVLTTLDAEDATSAFAAIAAAAPGGLGHAERHDVRQPPTVGLLAAMAEAADRDRIAWNYAHDFDDIFRRGLPTLHGLRTRGWPAPWCATGLYLGLLAELPDSHIGRKYDASRARAVSEAAGLRRDLLMAAADPTSCEAGLLAWDRELKEQGLNPGTTADLVVATLFAARLIG